MKITYKTYKLLHHAVKDMHIPSSGLFRNEEEGKKYYLKMGVWIMNNIIEKHDTIVNIYDIRSTKYHDPGIYISCGRDAGRNLKGVRFFIIQGIRENRKSLTWDGTHSSYKGKFLKKRYEIIKHLDEIST